MSEVVAFSRWLHSLECCSCEEGETCNCTPDDMARIWRLTGTRGMIERFPGTETFYGTWPGGRTGAVDDLDKCKTMVEKATRS